MDPLPPSLPSWIKLIMPSSTIQWVSGRRWYCDSTFEIHIQYDILAPRLGKVQTVTTWSLPVNVTASLTLFTPSLHPPFTHPPNAEKWNKDICRLTGCSRSLPMQDRRSKKRLASDKQHRHHERVSWFICFLSFAHHSLTQHPLSQTSYIYADAHSCREWNWELFTLI